MWYGIGSGCHYYYLHSLIILVEGEAEEGGRAKNMEENEVDWDDSAHAGHQSMEDNIYTIPFSTICL